MRNKTVGPTKEEASGNSAPDALDDEGISTELGIMVDQGLLAMGVNEFGEALYWATERGAKVLGMEVA